jgi:hypothetical protein
MLHQIRRPPHRIIERRDTLTRGTKVSAIERRRKRKEEGRRRNGPQPKKHRRTEPEFGPDMRARETGRITALGP